MSYPVLLTSMAALFVLLTWAGAWVVLPLARGLAHGQRRSASALTAATLLAPPALALLASASVVAPNVLGGCHCPAHSAHHSHLCVIHPTFAHPFVGPALAFLAAWLLLISPKVIGFLRDLRATIRLAKAARTLPTRSIGDVEVRVADWGIHGAFTVGMLSPVIVIDRLLLQALDDEQQRAIALHEQAHVTRRDGLTLAVLHLCRSLFPALGAKAGIARWKADTERTCDQHAAAELDSSTTVAEALIAVERLRATATEGSHVRLPQAALGIAAGRQLETRVMALLDEKPVTPRQQRLANDLFAVGIIAIGVTALMLAWPGDALHHAVEHGLEALFASEQG